MKTQLTLLGILAAFNLQSQDTYTPDKFRTDVLRGIASLKVIPLSVASINNDFIANGNDSIGIRIYRPEGSGDVPIVYHVHGAGFAAGDLDTHDNICRYLTVSLKAMVVAVDYRRSPEHKFPTPLDDTYAVFKWINTNRNKLGGNGKLVLIGDNAGANLIAAVCQKNLLERRPSPITVQALINPALDLRTTSPVYKKYPVFIDWYLNEKDDREDIRISPLLVKDCGKLPPAIIVVGETEEIRSDGKLYNEKLIRAGVKSDLFVQPLVGHLGIHWDAASEKAFPAMDFVVKAIKDLYLK